MKVKYNPLRRYGLSELPLKGLSCIVESLLSWPL